MPRTNETTVQKDNEGRYKTPVPKFLGDSHDLEGKKLEWKQISGNAFRVEVVEKDE